MSLKPTIEQLRGLGHHQTTYDWGIQFISLPSLISGFTSSDLNTRCTTANVPEMSIEEMPLTLRGHKAFQHGIPNYGNKLTLKCLYEYAVDACNWCTSTKNFKPMRIFINFIRFST